MNDGRTNREAIIVPYSNSETLIQIEEKEKQSSDRATEKKKEELGAEKLQPKVTRAQSMSVLNGMEKIKVRTIFVNI